MSATHNSLLPSFKRPPSRVAIRRAASYQADLAALLEETLRAFDLPVQGRSVLLKPNFVEPDPQGVINTHPAVVAAARECFLRLGAKTVIVAEGPGNERDIEAVLEANRLRHWLGPEIRKSERESRNSKIETGNSKRSN